MKPDQKFTPKYWVCHNPDTDDVMIETARKSHLDSVATFISKRGYCPENVGYQCSLIQIQLIDMEGNPL